MCEFHVIGHQLEAEKVPAEAAAHDASRPGTHEGIQDQAVGGTSGQYTRLNQFFWKYGEVSVAALTERNRPDRSLVSSAWVKSLIPTTIVQVGIAFILTFLGRPVPLAQVPSATSCIPFTNAITSERSR